MALAVGYYIHVHVHVLMKKERKKQARSNKQTRQSNTDAYPRQSLVHVHVHVYTRFGVWCHWWFHYPGLLLHTEFMVSLFIRCTMRCEIWQSLVHVLYMYILGLVFGVIGGFITPAFSFILSLWLACSSGVL